LVPAAGAPPSVVAGAVVTWLVSSTVACGVGVAAHAVTTIANSEIIIRVFNTSLDISFSSYF
jgi:hypothetical protein